MRQELYKNMSGVSDSTICPICEETMNTYTDHKPLDNVSGECYNCGFCYYTRTEQMTLKEVNDMRDDVNRNGREPDDEKLPMLTQKDLDKYADDIKSFW